MLICNNTGEHMTPLSDIYRKKGRRFKWRTASTWLDAVSARVKEEDGGIVREAFERAVTRTLLADLDPGADPSLHSFASDAILDITPNQAIAICKEALEAKEEVE
tara:strand:- start:1174 stop:1488 length:315 start_codon:yes stop_codon:yes gene_type:complete